LDQPAKYDRLKPKPALKKTTDVNKLRADLDNLTKNTSKLEESLGGLDALKDLKGMRGSNVRFQGRRDNDDDDGLHDISTKKNN